MREANSADRRHHRCDDQRRHPAQQRRQQRRLQRGLRGRSILVVRAAVAGEDAPAGLTLRLRLQLHDRPRASSLATWTFSLGSGAEPPGCSSPPGEIPCSLTVTDDGGADGRGRPLHGRRRASGRRTCSIDRDLHLRDRDDDWWDPTTETVVEEGGISLTIPEGSRDAPYAVLLEADGENCDGALGAEGELITCFTVTVFDSRGRGGHGQSRCWSRRASRSRSTPRASRNWVGSMASAPPVSAASCACSSATMRSRPGRSCRSPSGRPMRAGVEIVVSVQ